jgi:hypothetical protein
LTEDFKHPTEHGDSKGMDPIKVAEANMSAIIGDDGFGLQIRKCKVNGQTAVVAFLVSRAQSEGEKIQAILVPLFMSLQNDDIDYVISDIEPRFGERNLQTGMIEKEDIDFLFTRNKGSA